MIRKFLVLAAIAALSFAAPVVASEHPPDGVISLKGDVIPLQIVDAGLCKAVEPTVQKVAFAGAGVSSKGLVASTVKLPIRFGLTASAVYHLRC